MENGKRNPLPLRFENVCFRLLGKYLGVDSVTIERPRLDVDFVVSGTERVVAEARLYRSFRLPADSLERSIAVLQQGAAKFGASRPILMVSAIVAPSQQRLAKTDGVELLGITELLRIASEDYESSQQLAEIFSEATNRSIDDARRIIESTSTGETGRQEEADFRATLIIPTPREGRRLCAAIRAIPNSTNATAYELAIEAALKYVFQGQLSGWRRQNTQTDLIRPDLIAKIHYDADSFWQELVRDFSTRFVCFDAKNYAKPVDQSQIYSTEKYLHREARRGTAIIVSRKGVDPGAERAMHGALRESGRIITWLTDDDICKMLDAKDSGSEVNEILSERVDDMLMRVSR